MFYGHASRVWSAEWLSSSVVVSIGEDASARVWDLEKGQCVHVETGHKVRDTPGTKRNDVT